MKTKRGRLVLIIIIVIATGGALFSFRKKFRSDAIHSFTNVYTIAGSPGGASGVRFEDPFGIAVGKDGDIYLTDGSTGKLWQIKPDGSTKVIVENLDTPSGIGVATDGSLVVAETRAHVIRRVYPNDGHSEIIAGTVGQAGFLDGKSSGALFNGPIGIVVGDDDTVYVADTYNDRVRAIEKTGNVRTIAGGDQAGFADGQNGNDARFNTPCGIALLPDGALVVADTGNHRIRRVGKDGSVTTIAGTGRAASEDGMLFAAGFIEPIGVVVDGDSTIYVVDYGGSTLRGCGWNLFPRVWTLAGGTSAGFQDGDLQVARLNHPTGLAILPDGAIIVVDNGNRVLRRIGDNAGAIGTTLDSNAMSTLWSTVSEIRAAGPPRWPFDPPQRPREIAATFGEIRGELTEPNKQVWFHNGLDIPGAYGETVQVVRTERVLNPISIKDVGTARERIRFPMLGYIHLRIGRDKTDVVLDESKFLVQRDSTGAISELRVRRGTMFTAGDPIGTLNNQNHVHLIVGPVGREINAIAGLDLPGIKDSVAPTFDENDVRLFDSSWNEFRSDGKDSRINIKGDVRIIVSVYDQMDGNATRRRLGLYRLGYQLFTNDGVTPAPAFTEPRWTISFESLPRDENAAQLAYAVGSGSGASGKTIFAYIVTNIVQGADTHEAFLITSDLADGDYTLRIFAEDYFGNRTTRDRKVRITSLTK